MNNVNHSDLIPTAKVIIFDLLKVKNLTKSVIIL